MLGELEQVAAGEDLAGLRGELLERGEQRAPPVGSEGGFLGRGGRLARGNGRRREQGEPVAQAGRANAVARLVGDDLQEPRPQRLTRPEAPERAPRLDDPVLGGVLGVGCIAVMR